MFGRICLKQGQQIKTNEGKMLEAKPESDDDEEGIWNMEFDGAFSKEGVGAGVWIMSPKVGK